MPWDEDRETYTYSLVLTETLPMLSAQDVKKLLAFLRKNFALLQADDYFSDDYCCADDGLRAGWTAVLNLLKEAYKENK